MQLALGPWPCSLPHLSYPSLTLYEAVRLYGRQGAFWGLLVGHVIGLTRMVLEFVFKQPACAEEDTRPGFFRFFVDEFHYTYFVVLNLFIVTVIMVIVSKLTSPQDKDKVLYIDHLFHKTISIFR